MQIGRYEQCEGGRQKWNKKWNKIDRYEYSIVGIRQILKVYGRQIGTE